MSDIDELRRLAEGVRRANAEQGYEGSSWRTQAAARTAYEEALSPERILALLDRIEQQAREIERWKEHIQKRIQMTVHAREERVGCGQGEHQC